MMKCPDKSRLRKGRFVLAYSSGCSPLWWDAQERGNFKQQVTLHPQTGNREGLMQASIIQLAFSTLYRQRLLPKG